MSEVHHTTKTTHDLLFIYIHCVVSSLGRLTRTAVTTRDSAPFFFSVNDPFSLTKEITSVV